MNTSEVLMLISAVFTAIAAIAAAIACFFHYFNSKPSIKVSKGLHKDQYFFFETYYNGNLRSYVAISLNIINSNAIAGVVDDVALVYNGETFFAETQAMNLSSITKGIKLYLADEEIKLNKLKLKCPLTVEGYSIKYGYFIVPGVPLQSENEFVANITYKIIGKRRTFKIKNVKFEREII